MTPSGFGAVWFSWKAHTHTHTLIIPHKTLRFNCGLKEGSATILSVADLDKWHWRRGWSRLRGANRHLISTTQRLHKVIMCTSPRWPVHSSYTECICQVSFNHRKKGSTSSLYKKQRWRKCKSLRFAGILRVAKKWCKVYVQMRDREALKQSATLSLLTQNTECLAGLGKNSILASAHYYFHCRLICTERREQVEENLERWRYALERRGL